MPWATNNTWENCSWRIISSKSSLPKKDDQKFSSNAKSSKINSQHGIQKGRNVS